MFEQYNGMLSELRADLKHFNETSNEYVKKERLQKCWEHLKSCAGAECVGRGPRTAGARVEGRRTNPG